MHTANLVPVMKIWYSLVSHSHRENLLSTQERPALFTGILFTFEYHVDVAEQQRMLNFELATKITEKSWLLATNSKFSPVNVTSELQGTCFPKNGSTQ